jgi:hypothetical protein
MFRHPDHLFFDKLPLLNLFFLFDDCREWQVERL